MINETKPMAGVHGRSNGESVNTTHAAPTSNDARVIISCTSSSKNERPCLPSQNSCSCWVGGRPRNRRPHRLRFFTGRSRYGGSVPASNPAKKDCAGCAKKDDS